MNIMKCLLAAAGALAFMSCGTAHNSRDNGNSDVDTLAAPQRQIEFDADTAFHYIETQVALGPRVPGSNAHALCGELIESTLKRNGADTVMTQRATVKNHKGEQIPIVNIMGRYNHEAQRRVLIVAHYDTRPWADAETDESKHSQPVPGANDGGSGVGVALELARMIGQNRPAIGVDFLFVDAEDSGESGGWSNNDETWCLGTQYWTAHMPYKTAADRPAFGIVLDMVGGDNAVFHRENISELMAPDVNTKVWGTALNSEYADRFRNSVSGSLVDDHLFINRAGIPCIDIVECNNAETGSFPPSWHTLDDDMRFIDRATLKAVGQVVADVIYNEPAEK